MENIDSWECLQKNNFNKAIELAEAEFNNLKSIPALRHKLFALLHLNRYDEANELAIKILELRNGENDFDFIMMGITYWLINQWDKAVHIWEQGQKAKYSDPAGGMEILIFLYYAAIEMKNIELKSEVLKSIFRKLKLKSSGNWPGPLGEFLANNLSIDYVLHKTDIAPLINSRQNCQIYFVDSIRYLEKEDMNEYIEKIKLCINQGKLSYIEPMYYLALGIYGKFKPQNK